jgi:cytoskeletal protein CcmA (bactofilin family)
VKSGDSVGVAKGQAVNSSLYEAGKTITIAGEVQGDVYCAGQNIDISGVVNGDVLCAGQDVHVSGTVHGNVRLAGQTVTITGKVDGSASIIGQTATIEHSAIIGRDATIAGQTVRIDGTVSRDLMSPSSSVVISGVVGRDAQLYGDAPTLMNGANVGGTLVYTSNDAANVQKGAVIAGTVQHLYPPQQKHESTSAWHRTFSPVFRFIATIITGGILLLIMPRWFKESARAMRAKPLGSLGIGVLSLIVTPVVAIILLVTIIGIPFGFLLFLVWFIALLAGMVFVSYAVGDWIVATQEWFGEWHDAAALVVGSVVLLLLMWLPVLGWLVSIVVLLIGLGGITRSILHSIRLQHAPAVVSKSKK